MNNRAAIYIRLSKEDRDKTGDESESIQNQRLILDAYAEKQNWVITDHYVDEDWSGSNRERPEFKRMIADAAAGEFNIVLVKSQSRFARDNKYVEDYIHNMFRDLGIRFVSILDNIDTAQAGYKLNSRVHAILDEEMLDMLSGNIRKSFEEKANQGQFFGSMPPYGYKKDPADKNHLVIDEEAAQIVRLIFEMTAEGQTYLNIAKHLNRTGCLTPSEYKKSKGYKVAGMYDRHKNLGQWSRDTIRSLVRNEVYRGTIINHKSTVVNFRTKKKRNIPRSQQVVVHNMHEAIIDEDLWNRVQTVLNSRRKADHGEKGEKHPLSGILYCSGCGSKLYKCKSGGISYFRCYRASAAGACGNNKRIRLDALEELVIDKINEVIAQYANDEYISEHMVLSDRIHAQLAQLETENKRLQARLTKSKEKIKKLTEKYVEGEIDQEIYSEIQQSYIKERDMYLQRITSISDEIKKLQKQRTVWQDKEAILKRYKHLEKLTIPAVSEFIDSILVGMVNKEGGKREIVINMAV